MDDVFLFQFAWKKAGAPAPVHVVPDGAEALRYLFGQGKYADRQQHPIPCLILLDLKLPYVPGLEVLRQMRQDPGLCKLIVVVLTSSSNEADIEQAYELGANSYLVKPSGNEEREQLVRRIQQYWLESNKMAASSNAAGEQANRVRPEEHVFDKELAWFWPLVFRPCESQFEKRILPLAIRAKWVVSSGKILLLF